MLVRRVIQHQLGDHAQSAPVSFAQKALKIAQRAIGGMNLGVIGDIVTIVAQRRRTEGQQPDRRHAQVLEVVQLLRQAAEVTDAVHYAVEKCAHMDLVNDGILVPRHVRGQVHVVLYAE